MFAQRYFAARYFAPRYFAEVGADPAPITGGVVWIWLNGASTPPGTSIQGTEARWICINGVWRIPVKGAPWPARRGSDDQR